MTVRSITPRGIQRRGPRHRHDAREYRGRGDGAHNGERHPDPHAPPVLTGKCRAPKKFLDHTLVNTAGPTDSEGSKDPETPETPTNPDKPKSDNGAKTDTKVETTTTAKNLANTGDQTFALVATAAAAGATLVVIALIMLIKRRKTH